MALPGPALPSGTVLPGEHYLLDSCLRIPLETMGFRPQRVHPFALDGEHCYVWLDGDRYTGDLRLIEPAYLRGTTPRLLVSHYPSSGGTDHAAAEHLDRLGFPVAGSATARDGSGASTAWIAVTGWSG